MRKNLIWVLVPIFSLVWLFVFSMFYDFVLVTHTLLAVLVLFFIYKYWP